jgi:thiamine pyrophosphate-dependent acetolactate synthase large subunit-like protein
MPRIALHLRHLFSRRQGAVVALSVPTHLLASACPLLPDLGAVQIAQPAPSARTVADVLAQLAAPGGPPAVLIGSGAVAHRDKLHAFVRHWGAVHFTTPGANAILPGSLGVVGNAAHGDVPRRLRELDVDTTHLEPWDFTQQGSPRVGGRRVYDETELEGALAQALSWDGCFVVDVLIDPRVELPIGARLDSADALFGDESRPPGVAA